MNDFSIFHTLHTADQPLLLANAWDAASAVLFQQAGAKAIATTSAGVAWSLGYADGGSLPPQEMVNAVRRIKRVLHVPLTVDMEDGYSNSPTQVAELVQELVGCGAIGINIEDGPHEPALLEEKIRAIRHALAGKEVFINARTDVWLQGLATGEAAVHMAGQRLAGYHAAGADGGFAPGVCTLAEVRQLAGMVNMPLNVIALPDMPPIADLFAAGARRISIGAGIYKAVCQTTRDMAANFLQQQNSADMFANAMSYGDMNALFAGQ